jgi:hypothetical protein
MTINKTGYFSKFVLPSWAEGAEELRALLEELWSHCYPDLYEEDCVAPYELVEAENRVLSACFSDDAGLGHRRLVRMALTFCSAVAATLETHAPGDRRTALVIARLEEWLRDPASTTGEDLLPLFLRITTPPQALHEALHVLYQSLKVLDRDSAVHALLEILDDCLEGYAIFPGSAGRRDLFNWWLIDVVPASWCLRAPGVIYTKHLPWPPPATSSDPADP